jgi:hypothetical protein
MSFSSSMHFNRISISASIAGIGLCVAAQSAFAQSVPAPLALAAPQITAIPTIQNVDTPLTISTLTVNGQSLTQFIPGPATYTQELAQGTTQIPVVAATTDVPNATVTITQALTLPGTATVLLMRGVEQSLVTIQFTVPTPEPEVVEPVTPVVTEPAPVVESQSRGGGGGGGGGSRSKVSKTKKVASAVDIVGPTKPVVLINKKAPRTDKRKVSLSLSASDTSRIVEMQVSHQRSFTDTKWIRYARTKSFELTGRAGVQTVYARFKDEKGNTSETTSDTIVLTAKGARMPVRAQTAPTYTQPTGSYEFVTDLEMGWTGKDVAMLQQLLIQKRVYAGPVTGYYGTLTALGVARYQKVNGLPATGKLDERTRTHLNQN